MPSDLNRQKEYNIKEITDEAVLKEMYGKADDYFKPTIIEKITDLDFLLSIVSKGESRQIMSNAIDRMLTLNRQEATKKLKELNNSWVDFQLMFEEMNL